MEYVQTLLILCPLVFLAGFVDSVAGGGGLISIPAYLFVGLPVHLASGTNKVVNGIGTASATWRFFRSGKIRIRIALWAAAGALGGAFVGARLALRMPEAILQACLLVALPVVAVFLAVKKDFGKTGSPTGKELPPAKEHLLSLLIGLVIGLYDGLVTKIAEVDALGLFNFVPFGELLVPMVVVFGAAGLFVGVFGSISAIRKFMDV